jgi:SPASM domain peptide maturase of grasp-with-spasm system
LLIWHSTSKNYQCQGIIKKEFFSLSTSHFFQSQSFNTCLYKKLYISNYGEIKNCPYAESYGNIDILSVQQIQLLSKNSAFTKHWNVIKDKIQICQDCELRHFCTDCRYFIKDKNDIYSQPANCGYNPYLAKWACESGYLPVEKFMKK